MAKVVEAINHAALDYGALHTTLKDQLSGWVNNGVLPGPDPCLTFEEEKELATFLVDCAAVGFGEVMEIAEQVILEKKATEKLWQLWG